MQGWWDEQMGDWGLRGSGGEGRRGRANALRWRGLYGAD